MARALDYAQDLSGSSWDFAVEIDRLLALGMTTSDLRWLAKRGYVSHAREITDPQDADRRFEAPQQNLAFAKHLLRAHRDRRGVVGRHHFPAANYLLTAMPVVSASERAITFAAESMANGSSGAGSLSETKVAADLPIDLSSDAVTGQQSHHGAWPHWDKNRRTFLVGEHLVKRFRVPSPNQESVLDAFQEEGWPVSIDDPLSPVPDLSPKRRLRDTIKCLNTNQFSRLIRFHGDGTGQRVMWELLAEPGARGDTSHRRFHRPSPPAACGVMPVGRSCRACRFFILACPSVMSRN